MSWRRFSVAADEARQSLFRCVNHKQILAIMMMPTREFILAQNDDLRGAVLRFCACASLPNCAELRRLTLGLEDAFKWLDGSSRELLFIEQFCAAIRGLSYATMDARFEGTRGAGWGVEEILLALVRMLRLHVVRVSDSARACAPRNSEAGSGPVLDQPTTNKVRDSKAKKVTTP